MQFWSIKLLLDIRFDNFVLLALNDSTNCIYIQLGLKNGEKRER